MSGSIDSASTPATVSIGGGKRDDIVASVQIKESVKDHVFPYAKFLWLMMTYLTQQMHVKKLGAI